MNTCERLAANLKALRLNASNTQQQTADIFQLKRSSYSGYEGGAAEPKLDMLIRFSNHYKVSLDTLLRRDITFDQSRHDARMQGTRMLVSKQIH